METNKTTCKATVDGKVSFTQGHCQIGWYGSLSVSFDRMVALVGSRNQSFSRPTFSLRPFSPSLLIQLSAEAMARGTSLDMTGTDIGSWMVEHDPKERRVDSYRLESASIRTKFFKDGIGIDIDSHTGVGVSEYFDKIIASDLSPITLSISLFIPTTELGSFILPKESAVFSMQERLSKLPTKT